MTKKKLLKFAAEVQELLDRSTPETLEFVVQDIQALRLHISQMQEHFDSSGTE
jgi:hypothetical protein